LQNGTVYVRRPGGSSEPARTQDDWEKLIDRLVKARQDDQLIAIRKIFNPSEGLDVERKPDLVEWERESYAVWQAKIADLPEDSAGRLLAGHWTFSFKIEPFDAGSLLQLNAALEREMPKLSGWPPFTYLHQPGRRPEARGDIVEAWLHNPEGADGSHSDYWRIRNDGMGFLLRPMQEDAPHFMSNRIPGPALPAFDWLLPVYRSLELLKFTEALAMKFADSNALASVLLRYYGCEGRRLCCSDFNTMLDEGQRCSQPVVSSSMTVRVAEIGINLEESVHALLVPIFEQFEFSELPRATVNRKVREYLERNQR